jgi:hypothetical protein
MLNDPEELVRDRVSERIDLEFKSILPGRGDKEKFEVLKDFSAFANSGGGVIYYGIAEDDGVANAVQPITTESFDEATRRLGQTLESGIEPRLQGVRFEKFESGDGYVLAGMVPARFGAPCRTVQNNQSKFFKRNQNFVSEMTYDEIRSAFDRSGAALQILQEHWALRLTQARNGETWRQLVNGPICLARLSPMSTSRQTDAVDLKALYGEYAFFTYPDWGGGSRSFNLDGLVVYGPMSEGRATAMVQIYRNGTIDAMRYGGMPWQDKLVIPSQTVASFFRESFFKFSTFMRNQEISGPYVFDTAILGTTGHEFGVGSRFISFDRYFSDRKDLILPSIFLDFEELGNESIVRNTLDVLWQGFGLTHCNCYSEDGNWII